MELDVRQIVRTVEHPHIVVPVDGQARDAADFPFVGQRFRPSGIDLIAGRVLRLDADPAEGDYECDANQQGSDDPDFRIDLHDVLSPILKSDSLVLALATPASAETKSFAAIPI